MSACYSNSISAPTRLGEEKSYVYLICNLKGDRFKLGKSNYPLVRSRSFMSYEPLDLNRSVQVQYGSSSRAFSVEGALQKALQPYKIPESLVPVGSGKTEWFDIRAMSLALEIIKLIPDDVHGGFGEIQNIDGTKYTGRASKDIERFWITYHKRLKTESENYQVFQGVERNFRMIIECGPEEGVSLNLIRRTSDQVEIIVNGLDGHHSLRKLSLRMKMMSLEGYIFQSPRGRSNKSHSILKTISNKESGSLIFTMDTPSALERFIGKTQIVPQWEALLNDIEKFEENFHQMRKFYLKLNSLVVSAKLSSYKSAY
jgi:hypothetical protein